MNWERLAHKIPDPYVLILLIITLAAVSTYVVPAGQYEMETEGEREVAIPGSYEQIEQQPVSMMDFLTSVQLGLIDSANIVFFVLIIGGALGVITSTDSLKVLLAQVIVKVEESGREEWLLVILPMIFGFFGGVVGVYEEFIPFVPLTVMLALMLDYDAIVGCSITLLGMAAGFAAAPLNPFTLGVAQGIADVPLYSGFWYRAIFWVLTMTVTVAFIIKYARRIKQDPSASVVSHIDYSDYRLDTDPRELTLTRSHMLVLGIFFISIIVLIVGVMELDWYINEIATLFLVMGLIAGLAYGLNPSTVMERFIEGAEDLVYAALIIGFARAILVVMEEGLILDTFIWALVQPLEYLPAPVAAAVMVPAMTVVNFFIPSGSGQAAVVTPILAPVSEIIGVPVQVAILAFQFGDGVSNIIIPTLGATMAMISIARIPYGIWVIYAGKLFVIQLVIGMFACALGVIIGLGPF